MPLKVHLIIISIIIGVVFMGWQVMQHFAAPPPAPVRESKNSIRIIRASWGMNCPGAPPSNLTVRNEATGNFSFDNAKPGNEPKIEENNVLNAVNVRCNGKLSCTIENRAEFIGFDPAPYCNDKQIVIEYRCYSFDRLWQIIIPPLGSGTIDCARVEQPR